MGTRDTISSLMISNKVVSAPSGMQVRVEVRKISPEIGSGLFALQDIPRGAVIWKVLPDLSNVDVITEERFTEIMDAKDPASLCLQDIILMYSYGDHAFHTYIGDDFPETGVMINPLDESRFINHPRGATQANVGDWESVFAEPGQAPNYHWSYALRDVKAGEELVEDYSGYCYTQWIIDGMHEKGVFPNYFDCKVHPSYAKGPGSPQASRMPDQAAMDGASKAAAALLALSSLSDWGECRI